MFRKCLMNLKSALILPLHHPTNIFNYFSFPSSNIASFLVSPSHIFTSRGVTYFINGSNNYFVTRDYARVGNNAESKGGKSTKSCSKEDDVVGTLQEILGCGIKEARKFYHLNERLFNDNDNAMEELAGKCRYCKRLGIPKKFILGNPWVLQLTDVEIERKIGLLKKWKFKNLASSFCLMKLATNKLSKYTQKTMIESSTYPSLNDSNRVSYLAEILKKEEEDITGLVLKYEYLLKMSFSKLESTLDVLIKNGLDPKYIFMDIWVVRYSIKDIQTRSKMLESLEPHELRSWMFHCGNEPFQRTIKLRDENRNAREPFPDDESYLCHRLNITPGTVQELYKRHSPLRCVQTTKLKDILDYLFAEGFKPIDICRCPRILCHSLLTIKERMGHMKSLGYRPQSLAVCCQTKKKFKIFINKLQTKQSSSFR